MEITGLGGDTRLGLRAGVLSRGRLERERRLEKHDRSLSQRKWCLPVGDRLLKQDPVARS